MPSVLWHCWLGGMKGIRPVKNEGDGRWALVGPDGMAPIWMVGVSASVNLPLHHNVHNVQKFLFWHRLTRVVPEKGRKTVVCVCVFQGTAARNRSRSEFLYKES